MGKLIRFELRKLFRQKSFYICLIAYVLIMLLMNYMTYDSSYSLAKQLGMELNTREYSGVYGALKAINIGALGLILGIFTPLLICDDYANGTIRNVLARGYTKSMVFVSKYIAILTAAVIFVFVGWIAGFLDYAILCQPGLKYLTVDAIAQFWMQVLLMMAYASIYFMVAIAIQKLGGSIAVCIMVATMAGTLFIAADLVLSMRESTLTVSPYWLGNIMNTLVEFDASAKEMGRALICSLCYMGGCVGIGWLTSFKKEY